MKGENKNMNKFLKRIATTLLGFAMAAGVGVAVCNGTKGANEVNAGAGTDSITRSVTTGLNSNLSTTNNTTWVLGGKSSLTQVITGNTTGITYKTNSMGLADHSNACLLWNKNAGLIVTANSQNYLLSSVSVVLEAASKTISCSVSNTAYTAMVDYDSTNAKTTAAAGGTLSWDYTSGSYKFFALRCNTATTFVNSITVVWRENSGGSVTPTSVAVSEKTALSGTYKGSATYECQATVGPNGASQDVDWTISSTDSYVADQTSIANKASISSSGVITFLDNTTVYVFATAKNTSVRNASGFSVTASGLLNMPTYSLVTNTTTLTAGSTLVFGATLSNVTYVPTTYSSQKLESTTGSLSGSTLSIAGAYTLTLGGSSSDGWTLKTTGNKYFGYSGSSTNFNLSDTVASDNFKWTISIDNSNVASIRNKGDTGRYVRINTTNHKFAPYSSTESTASWINLYGNIITPADATTVTVKDENNGTSSSINLGGSVTLTATFDSAATTTSCNWSLQSGSTNGSLNKTTGMSVTFTASSTNYGETVIRATANDTTAKYGEYTVTVVDNRIHVTEVSINGGDESIGAQVYGSKKTLTATVTGQGGETPTDSSVTWSITSGNDKVSLSSTTGDSITLTALAAGTAVVTCTANDTENNAADSITVNVSAPYVALNSEVFFYTDVDKNSSAAKYELTSLTENTGTDKYGTGAAYDTTPSESLVFTVVQGYASDYVAFKTPDNKYLSHTSSGISLYLATVTGDLTSANSWLMDTYNTNYVKIIPANETSRFICMNVASDVRFGCYASIQTAYVRLRAASALVADTVTINNPGTIYDGDEVDLTAVVTYVGVGRTNGDVTWSKVSGSSSLTSAGKFTASGTTATVVRATSNVNGSNGQPVTADYTITPLAKMIVSGQKYFVVSSNNEIFLAKGLDGSTGCGGSDDRTQFLSTVTLSEDGRSVTSISGVDSDSFEDYAWTITEESNNEYVFSNGTNYFNIYQNSKFYIDNSTGSEEHFRFDEIDSSGYYGIYSLKANLDRYLNISNGTFDTTSNVASTGFKFIKYHAFGTLDRIEVDELHTKTAYALNSTFNEDDLFVVGYDEDGYSKRLSSDDFSVSGNDLTTTGQKTITVTASGKQDTYTIRVVKSREVIKSISQSGTFNFDDIDVASGSNASTDKILECYSAQGLSAPSLSISNVYGFTDAIRLATGSASGSITFDFGLQEVKSISIVAHGWSNTESSCTMTIKNNSTTLDTVTTTSNSSSDTFNITLTSAVTSLTFTAASKNRICIESIVFSYTGEKDIGLTDDCIGLEAFIDEYLHMSDYTSSQGWCKDTDHNYYGKNTETGAKWAFNHLNSNQRALFSTHSAYTVEYNRLVAWASANGETLQQTDDVNTNNTFASVRISPLVNIIGESTNTIAIIVIISMVSMSAIGGYFFLRKRKEN